MCCKFVERPFSFSSLICWDTLHVLDVFVRCFICCFVSEFFCQRGYSRGAVFGVFQGHFFARFETIISKPMVDDSRTHNAEYVAEHLPITEPRPPNAVRPRCVALAHQTRWPENKKDELNGAVNCDTLPSHHAAEDNNTCLHTQDSRCPLASLLPSPKRVCAAFLSACHTCAPMQCGTCCSTNMFVHFETTKCWWSGPIPPPVRDSFPRTTAVAQVALMGFAGRCDSPSALLTYTSKYTLPLFVVERVVGGRSRTKSSAVSSILPRRTE